MPGAAPTPAGVVLAGGAGRRLGTPKAVVDLHGEPLAARAVRLLRAAGCAPVVVSARADRPLPPLDAPVVWDPPEVDSVLAALAAALAAVDADEVVVLACDLPLAGPLVARLVAQPPGPAVAVDADGRLQPLCARYPRAVALPAARAAVAEGRLRATDWAAGLAPQVVWAEGRELAQCNTPEELAAVRAWTADGPG